MKEQDQVQELTFENLMARLEEYVSELEKGGLSLDKAAEIYETGMMIAGRAAAIEPGAWGCEPSS